MIANAKSGILIPVLFLCCTCTFSQPRWSFELQFGTVYSLNLPLTIKQSGYPDIKIRHADFDSEPFKSPPYWNIRLSKWWEKKSLEVEFVHHKFYLQNKPAEVQRFGISHGFNMLILNHGHEFGKYIIHAGLGTNFIHAESTIRGMKYPEKGGFDLGGHKVRGVAVNVSGSRQIKLNKTFFLNVEAKIHGAVADAPVVNGSARVNILVFQLIFGPGINWSVREKEQ